MCAAAKVVKSAVTLLLLLTLQILAKEFEVEMHIMQKKVKIDLNIAFSFDGVKLVSTKAVAATVQHNHIFMWARSDNKIEIQNTLIHSHTFM